MAPAEHPSYGTSYFLQAMATLGIWVGLAQWGGLSNEVQQYEVILVWMLAFRPLSTLIHELGHAAAVRYLARRPADVVVGAGSPAVKGRLGQVSISFSVIPVLGSQVGGICRYRPDGVDWRTRGWISLAGPGATLLELLVLVALMPLWSDATVLVRDIFAVGGAMLVVNLVVNLLPTPLVRDQRGRVVLGRDGYNARSAFLNARAGLPVVGMAAAASASMADVEPTPGRIGVSEMSKAAAQTPAPARSSAPVPSSTPAPSSPRTLADIWSSPPVSDEDPEAAATAARSAGEGLARGDFAQRALAEIWRGQQPAVVNEPPRPTRGPARPPAPTIARDASQTVAGEAPQNVGGEAPQTVAGEAPQTVGAQLELADTQLREGRIAQAIAPLESALTMLEAATDPGARHARDLAHVRARLARAYLMTRRPHVAIELYQLLLADTSEPSTADGRVAYRVAQAQAHRAMGEAHVAIDQLEALVAELDGMEIGERLIDAAVELATTYVIAHRIKDGVHTYEAALPRAEGLLGSSHPKTLRIRVLLARAYLQDQQTELATSTLRAVASDSERALGPDHELTRRAYAELTAVLRNQIR